MKLFKVSSCLNSLCILQIVVMETLDDRRVWSVSLGDLTKAKGRGVGASGFFWSYSIPIKPSICHSHKLTLVLTEKMCKGEEGGYFFKGPGRVPLLAVLSCFEWNDTVKSQQAFYQLIRKDVSSPRLHKILQEASKTNYCFLSNFYPQSPVW